MKFLDTCILFIHRLLLQKMNHKVQRNTRRAVNKIFYILFSVCVFVSPMILQNKQTNKPNYWILRYLPESISKVKITLTSLVVSFWKLQINIRKVYSYFSSFVVKNMINVSYYIFPPLTGFKVQSVPISKYSVNLDGRGSSGNLKARFQCEKASDWKNGTNIYVS